MMAIMASLSLSLGDKMFTRLKEKMGKNASETQESAEGAMLSSAEVCGLYHTLERKCGWVSGCEWV